MNSLPFHLLVDVKSYLSVLGAAFLACAFYLLLAPFLSSRNKSASLPPGPRGLPFLGNLLQLKSETYQWYTFTKWKQLYGPIFYLSLAGQPVYVLNTYKVASEFFERRARIYSDRPRFIVAQEFLCRGMLLGLARYGDIWKSMRRASHEALNITACNDYHSLQITEAVLLAHGILMDPDHWESHAERAMVSSMMTILYDAPPLRSSFDPSVAIINELGDRVVRATEPGAHLVELFNFLQYTPSWLAKWKSDANKGFEYFTSVFEQYFHDVNKRVLDGDERSSFCAKLLSTKDRHGLDDRQSAWLLATLYSGGGHTSSYALYWFLFTMVSFPDAQQKAQQEIDEVVGRSRFPRFADIDRLPYICALVKEVLRWRPIAPLGLAHTSSEDDWYEGYFVRKGTFCIPNIWAMNHDPDVYGSDADDFRPERFLDSNDELMRITKGEGHWSYGFGSRLCPGRHLANNALFIDVATVLWAIKLEALLDPNGDPILPSMDGETKDGTLARPKPFKFSATPRSANVESMLQQAQDEIFAGRS